MKTMFDEAREILSKIDFGDIWPGFVYKEIMLSKMLLDATDADFLAAHLVCDMFRDFLCLQRGSAFENYPKDLDNYRLKIAENHYLVKACMENSMVDLQQFLVLREARKRIIGESIKWELRVETDEGLAEYAGLSALNQISRAKFMGEIERHFRVLRNPESLIDMHLVAQSSGCVICFALKTLGIDFYNHWEEKPTIYEHIPHHPSEINIIFNKIVGE